MVFPVARDRPGRLHANYCLTAHASGTQFTVASGLIAQPKAIAPSALPTLPAAVQCNTSGTCTEHFGLGPDACKLANPPYTINSGWQSAQSAQSAALEHSSAAHSAELHAGAALRLGSQPGLLLAIDSPL